MSARPTSEAAPDAHPGAGEDGAAGGPSRLLFDTSGIDLTRRVLSRADIERWNPHRGTMSFLDAIVWHAPDWTRAVGLKQVRSDEFWVAGHFPGRPTYPGVLMIETGAQLACYMFIVQKAAPTLAAFLRIESAAFRAPVVPGDDLLILCQEVRKQKRRFITDVQGVVGDRIAFEARISGMMMEERKYD